MPETWNTEKRNKLAHFIPRQVLAAFSRARHNKTYLVSRRCRSLFLAGITTAVYPSVDWKREGAMWGGEKRKLESESS